MIKVFVKYLIHSLWFYACRAKKNYVSFDFGSKIIFSLLVSLVFYIIILIVLISISNIFPIIIDKLGQIIIYGMFIVCLSGIILTQIINYELVKKITITKKEKQLNRFILVLIICFIVLIKWIYKN